MVVIKVGMQASSNQAENGVFMSQGHELDFTWHNCSTSKLEKELLINHKDFAKSEVCEEYVDLCSAGMSLLKSHEQGFLDHPEVLVIDELIEQIAVGKNSEFFQSRGCPIQHLAWLEANGKLEITHVPKHENIIKEDIKEEFLVLKEQFQ